MAGNRKNPTRGSGSTSQYSLMEFMQDFPNDDACLAWLWRTRFDPNNTGEAHCPACEEVRPFKRYATTQQRQSWTCTACGHHLHPTAGTIFHKSSTSLHLWFYAMYLITSTRCGISAKQLERELGVTYKTAWRMFHLIRRDLMKQDETPLTGDVEADETYIGGRLRASDRHFKNKGRDRTDVMGPHAKPKVMVFGAVERGGRVRATALGKEGASGAGRVGRVLFDYVHFDANLYTDDSWFYHKTGKRYRSHHTIRHKHRVYVRGNVHTSSIDGFWSLVKRGINGVYHAVSPQHLQGYLNEYAWRYNHRKDGRTQFALLLLRSALR